VFFPVIPCFVATHEVVVLPSREMMSECCARRVNIALGTSVTQTSVQSLPTASLNSVLVMDRHTAENETICSLCKQADRTAGSKTNTGNTFHLSQVTSPTINSKRKGGNERKYFLTSTLLNYFLSFNMCDKTQK